MRTLLLALLLSTLSPAFAADSSGNSAGGQTASPQSSDSQTQGSQPTGSNGETEKSEPAIVTFCRAHTC